jgi:hypothetical protein
VASNPNPSRETKELGMIVPSAVEVLSLLLIEKEEKIAGCDTSCATC